MKIRLLRRQAGVVVLSSMLLGLGGASILAASTGAFAVAGDPANTFSCRASALRVDFNPGPLSALGVVEPFVANDPDAPCTTQSGGLLGPTVVGPVQVSLVSADTTVTENNPAAVGDAATAFSSVASVDVNLGALVISARVLTADANTVPCDSTGSTPTLEGDSHVVSLTINGSPVEIPTDKSTPSTPTLDLSPLATLWLREEIVTGSSLTERALELDTILGNITIAEARVDRTGNPCKTTTPCKPGDPPPCPPCQAGDPPPCPQVPCGGQGQPPCCPDGSAPPCPDNCPNPHEKDPNVDPTAKATAGMHPDCVPDFSPPKGDGDNTGLDYVHFVRDIGDTEKSPDGAFTPKWNPDSRNRFNGEAGFLDDGATKPMIEGKFYDDEDMKFRLAPKSIAAYYAPNDLASSPWRRFCGTGTIDKFGSDDESTMTMAEKMASPVAPFKVGQERKFMVETFDAKWLNPDSPGGDQSDYWVIDIYKPGSTFDTTKCDPSVGGDDHHGADLDYHSEGQTIAGNIQIHSDRVKGVS